MRRLRGNLDRVQESRAARVLYYLVTVPLFVVEAAFAIVLTGGAVWGLYLAAKEAPIFLLLFPPLWFLAFWLLSKLWAGAPSWWRSWRVARGSRVVDH